MATEVRDDKLLSSVDVPKVTPRPVKIKSAKSDSASRRATWSIFFRRTRNRY